MPQNWTTLTGTKETKGSIRSWVGHSEIDPEAILEEAEAWIYERLRVFEMRTRIELTFADGDYSQAVPATLLDPIRLRIHGDSRDLPYLHEKLVGLDFEADGTYPEGPPNCWTLHDGKLWFDGKFTETTTKAEFWFYGRPTALGSGNTTNFLTAKLPTLLRRACLAFAYEYRNDTEKMNAELALAEIALNRANASADMMRRGQQLR